MVTEQARDYYSFVGQFGADFDKGTMKEYNHSVNVITMNNDNSTNHGNCSRSNSFDSGDEVTTSTNTTNNNNNNNKNRGGGSDRVNDYQNVEHRQLYFDGPKTHCENETLDCISEKNNSHGILTPSDVRSLGLPVNGFRDIVLFDNDDFVAICENFVKLYSTSGDLLHKIELASTPLSLCRVGERRVVVTCTSRVLRLIAVHIDNDNNNNSNNNFNNNNNGSGDNNDSCRTLVLEQELNTATQYCSVAQLSSSELIAVGLNAPVLHRLLYMPTHLEVLSTLYLEQVGKLNVRHQRSYRCVCVSAAKQILISDRMNNFVISLSTSGTWKIPFFYKPQGMVVAGSFFYVIQGGGLNLVYRFRLNGLDAFCLLRKEHELLDPWGLSINRNKKLVITCNTSDCPTVRVFT
ncbi:putative uncharacterized protein DDB_G0267840 [Octopus sinensis]|uniref:Uncharacterized protein n=1 Tax=Octopus sinensis TaxID=2607531 RepID=A0A7E6EKH4_9MOLL|nr:putative uncharacterized protein DDB_G0267840 [Octopus sinensis]XP_036355833.1 putative uncharacterized protein DDB_G0267840 [Octopus sinensis]